MRHRAAAGFTLLELAIVVGVIAILAAVAIPGYITYVARAQVAEGLHLVGPLKEAVTAYYDRWGVLPKDNAAAGLPPREALRGTQVMSMEVRDGTIVIRYAANPRLLAHDTLFLRPARLRADPAAPLLWLCHAYSPAPGVQVLGPLDKSVAIESAYLPGACR
jgi:type IV pilus assembly protein PilA